MIKLYIQKDGVEFLTDLNKDESVTLTTQVNDFETISGALAPYTLQFTIPCSDKNNSILKQYSKIDISSSINPHQSIDARMVVGEMIEIKGGVEVKGYSVDNRNASDYKIVFYGQEFTIKNQLDKQLNEIDWSDYNYKLTYENMKLSWDGTLNDGKVLLPVMSHVRDYLYQPSWAIGQNHPNNIADNTVYYEEDDDELEKSLYPGILLDELKTALRLQDMIETIYADAGISLTWGTTIDAFLDNVFVIPSIDAGKAKNTTVIQEGFVCIVKYDSDTFQTLGTTYANIEMPTEVSDFSELWDGTDTFTAPENGTYRFALTMSGVDTNVCLKDDTELRYRALRNSTTQFGNESEWFPCKASPTVYFEGYLLDGETVEFQGKTDSGTIGYRFFQLVLVDSPTTFYDQTTATADNMPDMTAYDFIKGFLATFNLMQVIELSDMGESLSVQSVKIVDKDEFYTGGTVRDWTRFIDTKKQNFDKPEIDKDLVLRYAEYEDKVNMAFFKESSRNYAQLDYYSEADFTGKDLDVNSIFTIFPPSFLSNLDDYGNPDGSTDLLVHSQFDFNGDPVNSDFLIFMYNGKQEGVVNTYYIQSGVDAQGEATWDDQPEEDFPYCSTHSAFPSTNASYALNFSLERPANYDMNTAALNTATRVFFDNYLQNLYSDTSKILSVEAIIPLKDIVDFQLNDIIEIQGIRYVMDTMRRDLLTGVTKLKLFTYRSAITYTKIESTDGAGDVEFSDTPTAKELRTNNVQTNPKTNINEGVLYLWKDYDKRIDEKKLITQADKNISLLPKAHGYATATSGAFTINTDSTQVLTIYNTVITEVRVKFNGEPPVGVTHNSVLVTHNTIPVSYSSAQAGRIYVYESGSYQFSSTTNFSLATLPQDVKLTLAVNGVGFYSRPLVTADQTTDWSIDMNVIIPLDIGDYVELLIAGTISQAYTINSATTNINRI